MKRVVSNFLFIIIIFSCTETTSFINEDGHREEHEVRSGTYHGIGKKFYQTGELSAEGTWQNGKKEGLFKEYYQDGTLRLETTYFNDLENGTRKLFDSQGRLMATGEFVNGNQHGITILYDSLGNKYKENQYMEDKITHYKDFYPSEQIKARGEYLNDSTRRLWTYFESGEPKEYFYLVKDTAEYAVILNEDGTIKANIFPLTIVVDSSFCVTLEHSIIPTDNLGISISLGFTKTFTNSDNGLAFNSRSNQLCFDLDTIPTNQIVYGYLYEIDNSTNEQLGPEFPFAYNLATMERVEWQQ